MSRLSKEEEEVRHIKRGRTIVAEREHAESESERMQARKKQKHKHRASAFIALLMLAVLGLIAYTSARGVIEDAKKLPDASKDSYTISAEIIDEAGSGQLSSRMQEYISMLERDFRDLGLKITKVVLPKDTTRELYVDIEGEKTYFKVNLDRGTAVTAEDASRMLKYLHEHDLSPAYVDIRVEGKAFYK